MQFQYKGFHQSQDYGDEDDDDFDQYGMEYYDEDDDDDMGVPPGALFQGKPGGIGGIPGGPGGPGQMGKGGYQGAISSASGVPFYGQQNKMGGGAFGAGSQPMTMGSAQGFGAGGMGMGMGGGLGGGSGGFTYGMASKGGAPFGAPAAQSNPLGGGATQFGAGASQFGAGQSQQPGLFQFGAASQFGGIGGGGGAGSLFGSSAPVDDPYANIAIDLNKVKKSEAPAKPHELKTEEEKKKEAEDRKLSGVGGKSNLKKDKDDTIEEERKKKGVRFGTSTTYEVTGNDESGNFTGDEDKDKDKEKRVIAQKDLSDGRNEKEKIKAQLEEEERERIEEIRKMNEWTAKRDQMKVKEGAALKAQHDDDSDSIEESSELQSKGRDNKEKLYDSDNFDENSQSASGSASKQKVTYWPGKSSYAKAEESYSASYSQSQSQNDKDVCDAGLMEAYLKKQQEKKGNQNNTSPPKVQPKKHEISESSDKYSDEFESLSKSQSQGPAFIDSKKYSEKQVSSFQHQQPSKSIVSTYIKKENRFIQTDEGKYSYMSASDAQGSTMKEWTLQKNLQDAELHIQELKDQVADIKQKNFDIEANMKKRDVEFQTALRESLNANETSKRLQEQLKDAHHKINLYKIETEELIKQIDIADAKTREKEDDLKLAQAEYDRKLKQQEERILFRRGKQDDRDLYELKREHQIQKEEIERKLDEKSEELDYYMQKVVKLENDNKNLRLGKDQSKKIQELENEIEIYKSQVNQGFKTQQDAQVLRNVKNELSRDEQIKLQRELQQLELMVKGYQEENEKSVAKNKQLEKDLKFINEKFFNESKKVKELQQKVLLEREKVYVEDKKEELDIDTVNLMGNANAISQKELNDLQQKVKQLYIEKSDLERDQALKENQLKSQLTKIRDEKGQTETKLLETEFLVSEKEREITKLKEEVLKEKEGLYQQIKDQEEKVAWFRQNQKILTEEDEDRQNALKENITLKERIKKAEEESKKAKDLEKKCKLLEETIKSKNPNSIPLLIQATKEQKQDNFEVQDLKEQIKRLEFELDEKDKEQERRLRALRQEQERMKLMYERRQEQTTQAKQIKELENELSKTKEYYMKRIRELEDKYKYKLNPKDQAKLSSKSSQNQNKESERSNQENEQLTNQIEQLTKERNLLAQKVVNLQTQTNRRQGSFSGPPGGGDDQKSLLFSTLIQLSSMINNLKGSEDPSMAFNFIQSCVSCVEQLKSIDPQKNNQLAMHFKNLTKELHQNGQINSDIIKDIQDICKADLVQRTLTLKTQQSAGLPAPNLDLEEDLKQKSPQAKPPKPSHPFVVQQTPKKNIKDILKQIINCGLDFERAFEENRIKGRRIGINQLYQILREEPSLKNISVDDVKSLQKYVKEKSGVEVEEIGKGKKEELDIQDLINVVMDVSLEIMNKDSIGKVSDSFSMHPNRYSQEKVKVSETEGGYTKSLRNEIQKQKDANEELKIEYRNKFNRLQKQIQSLNNEKEELEDGLTKAEAGKRRLENIIKRNLGSKALGKTGGSTGDSGDMLDEVGLMMKRLEFLEQQSEERTKNQGLEHEPFKREIQRLQQALQEETLEKNRILDQKNKEVSYFKAELDGLLSEMKNTFKHKKQRN